jgi:tetratricopeptide (TPR) repeat protein
MKPSMRIVILLAGLSLVAASVFWRYHNDNYYNKYIANADYYEGKGFAEFTDKNLDGAIADCTKAIELNPDDDNAYIQRGYAKNSKGDKDGALADFNKECGSRLASFSST